MRLFILIFTITYYRDVMSYQEIIVNHGDKPGQLAPEGKSENAPSPQTLCNMKCPKTLNEDEVKSCFVGCDMYQAQLQISTDPDVTEYTCHKGCSSMARVNFEYCAIGCSIMNDVIRKVQVAEQSVHRQPEEINDNGEVDEDIKDILEDDSKEKINSQENPKEEDTNIDNVEVDKDVNDVLRIDDKENDDSMQISKEKSSKQDNKIIDDNVKDLIQASIKESDINNKEENKVVQNNDVHEIAKETENKEESVEKEEIESNEIPNIETENKGDQKDDSDSLSVEDDSAYPPDNGYTLYIVGNMNDVLQYLYEYRKYSILRHYMLQQMKAGRDVDNRQMDMIYNPHGVNRPTAQKFTDEISNNIQKYFKQAKNYFVNDFNSQFFQILLLGICIGVLFCVCSEMMCAKKKKRTIPCTQDYFTLDEAKLPPPILPTYEECVKKVVILDTADDFEEENKGHPEQKKEGI